MQRNKEIIIEEISSYRVGDCIYESAQAALTAARCISLKNLISTDPELSVDLPSSHQVEIVARFIVEKFSTVSRIMNLSFGLSSAKED